MLEEPILFGRHGNLMGILTMPPDAAKKCDTAVLLMNAGLIHRVGPGRLYVTLARRLARCGFPSLRFDFSNVGDSPARPDRTPVLDLATIEPREAMDALARRGADKFILLGVCSGAYAAFKSTAEDPRVSAAVLINPQEFIGDPNWTSRSWAKRYFTRSLFSRRAWFNLLTGRINYKRLFATLAQQLGAVVWSRNAQFVEEEDRVRGEVDRIRARKSRLLFLLSDEDVSVEQLSMLIGQDARQVSKSRDIDIAVVPGADHLFTRESDKAAIIEKIEGWLETTVRVPE